MLSRAHAGVYHFCVQGTRGARRKPVRSFFLAINNSLSWARRCLDPAAIPVHWKAKAHPAERFSDEREAKMHTLSLELLLLRPHMQIALFNYTRWICCHRARHTLQSALMESKEAAVYCSCTWGVDPVHSKCPAQTLFTIKYNGANCESRSHFF